MNTRGMSRGLKRYLHAGLRHLRSAARPIRRRLNIVRYLLRYRVPGEQDSCPACGADGVRHLEPLTSGRKWFRFGFVSGCRQCGVLFANPLPTTHELEAVYSPSGEWGRHRQEEQEKQVSQRRLEQLFAPVAGEFDVMHPRAGSSVLDFGCGLGGMLDAFAAAGWDTFGIDPSTSAAFARHQQLKAVPAEPRFDLAVLHHVLEHVTDPLDILRAIGGAVRDGGYLLISVPNLDDLASHGEFKYCIRSQVHVLAYSTACLQWLLAEAGFRVVSSQASSTRARQRVVVARRGAGNRPPRPLAAGAAALRRYFDGRREELVAPRLLPVRQQAAYADLVRAEWRLPKPL